ncbi:MAG: hypothetical protein OEZ59_04905 [Deltaproteobacteria bacterium]|nr:hypothetical protein [Deltaproteobacteria bacterium]
MFPKIESHFHPAFISPVYSFVPAKGGVASGEALSAGTPGELLLAQAERVRDQVNLSEQVRQRSLGGRVMGMVRGALSFLG